jgi:hypothetical protein
MRPPYGLELFGEAGVSREEQPAPLARDHRVTSARSIAIRRSCVNRTHCACNDSRCALFMNPRGLATPIGKIRFHRVE